MLTIAHLSDLHFGRLQAGVVHRLAGDLKRVAPDLTVISGDLTQHGRRREFRAARHFLNGLPGEWLSVPGNHDLPRVNLLERFTEPFERYRRLIGPDLCPVWRHEEAVVVGVNTARSFGPHWNWAHGRISRGQVRHVAEVMASATPRQTRIVVAHHPFVAPEIRPDLRLVGGRKAATEQFARCGVDVILSGHFHVGYAAPLTHEAAPGGHVLLAIQASTATSSRVRGDGNAYNVLTFDGPRIDLQVRRWRDGGFEPGPMRRIR